MIRITTRRIVLPADTPARLVEPHPLTGRAPRTFRAEHVVEALTEGDAPERDSPTARRELGYRVSVSGPVLTSTGKAHANHRETRRFAAEPRWGESPLSALPPEVAAELVGPEVLGGAL